MASALKPPNYLLPNNTDDFVPSYTQCVVDVFQTFTRRWARESALQYAYPMDFFRQFANTSRATTQDWVAVLMLAVAWTLIRYAFSCAIFTPFAKWMKMTQLNQSKFPESAWKLVFYTFAWILTIYILFIDGRYPYFENHLAIWRDWSATVSIPPLIDYAYKIQLSFYLHSIYGTLFMDHWRKDSIVMLMHHFLTLGLIGFSFALRFYKIGLLVLFVHDVTDIALEFTKCNVYLKDRGGFWREVHDKISTVGFLTFAVTWFVFRLYWYPLKVVYSATVGSDRSLPGQGAVPFFFFQNSLLYLLQGLNIYWFTFILNFLYKVLTGQMSEVDDVREVEVVEKISNFKPTANGEPHSNSVRARRSRAKKEI